MRKLITAVTSGLMLLLSPVSAVHAEDIPWVTTDHITGAPELDADVFLDLDSVAILNDSSEYEEGDPRWPKYSNPLGCTLVAWEVSKNPDGPWLGARGGRQGCDSWATYRVKIMKSVPLRPDRVIATADGEGNSTVVAVGRCDGRATYYTRVESSTGRVFSGGPRQELC